MVEAFKQHWPEYLMEAAALGLFMISACTFGVLFEYPDSPVRQALGNPDVRRVLMGLAMGATAVSIIYSPFGKQSGAHMNPAVTLAFFRLGKIAAWDAVFYIAAQFAGGVAGVVLTASVLRHRLAYPSVNYVATLPGSSGVAAAFAAEFVISFALMLVVLIVSNARTLNRWTGVFAGTLVALYITFEAPISGMSMNPARTLGSAYSAGIWDSVWIYFTAPPLAMLLAATVFQWQRGAHHVLCAKLHHENDRRCIFRCNYGCNDLRAIEPVRTVMRPRNRSFPEIVK